MTKEGKGFLGRNHSLDPFPLVAMTFSLRACQSPSLQGPVIRCSGQGVPINILGPWTLLASPSHYKYEYVFAHSQYYTIPYF